MEDYLRKFIDKADGTDVGDLPPKEICPFLFYNLTPYIFTLAKGGWFDWVRRRKRASYRKKIDNGDFKRKEVNRLYPNEVLVRCPNPGVMVVASVGPWIEGQIKIRILHAENLCLHNHKPEDEIIMNKNDALTKTLGFNSNFPWVLSPGLFTDGLLSEAKDICKLDDKITTKITQIINPCRYHKKTKEFKSDLLPLNFCMHIFATIYPYILAKMYNAKIDEKLEIRCPVKRCDVVMTLTKTYRIKTKPLRLIKDLLKKLSGMLFYPPHLIDYDFAIKVLDIENKHSECFLYKGKEYPVNLRSEDFMCPASLHVLYPYLLLNALGGEMIWRRADTFNPVPCPDCVGVVYSIKREA